MTLMSASSTPLTGLSLGSLLHAQAWRAVRRACGRIGCYFTRRREEWIAAALYRELSKLSDAELERRGIARGDLARYVSNLIRSMD
jgi:hypothetical protein